jgi:hypothetical protein
VAELAPDGVAAVFDNIGGRSFDRSFRQLARGGTLVAYGTADQLVDGPSVPAIFASIIARFAVWNATPNGRRALFYNFWGGKSLRPARFRRHLAADLTSVLGLLAEDAVVARIAVRDPVAGGRPGARARRHPERPGQGRARPLNAGRTGCRPRALAQPSPRSWCTSPEPSQRCTAASSIARSTGFSSTYRA